MVDFWKKLPLHTVAIILLAFFMLLVVAPQLVAVLLTTGGDYRRINFFQLLKFWITPDPTVVTGSTAGFIVHHSIAAVTLGFILGLVLFTVIAVLKQVKDPQNKKGLACLKDVAKNLAVKQLVSKRGIVLRPSLAGKQIKPSDVGYRVGEFKGTECYLTVEDPTIIVGPSRAGKGWYLVLNWILDAPGAVVTTSSKMDNLILTLKQKQRQNSACYVFAPGVIGAEKVTTPMRWDPVAGCVTEETLVRRIKALIPSDSFSGSTTNGGHWDTLGQQLAAHLFHAAACMNIGVDAIWDWVANPQRATAAVAAIRSHPEGLLEHANHLETVLNLPPEQRAVQWGVLPTVLAFMESRTARRWLTPEKDEVVNLAHFVLNKGTLYLVGDKQTTAGYVRIIDGLLAEIDYITKGLADVSPASRLDPPITYVLDEAGNFEYQGLYELITAGGGRGRVCHAVFQSKAQLSQWGSDNQETLWDAATAKIILPGGADPKALDDITKLIGELWTDRQQLSYSSGFLSVPQVSISQEKRAVIETNELRELPAGYALLFYRNMKPVIAKMSGFNTHKHFKQCIKDAEELTGLLVEASPFAKYVETTGRA